MASKTFFNPSTYSFHHDQRVCQSVRDWSSALLVCRSGQEWGNLLAWLRRCQIRRLYRRVSILWEATHTRQSLDTLLYFSKRHLLLPRLELSLYRHRTKGRKIFLWESQGRLAGSHSKLETVYGWSSDSQMVKTQCKCLRSWKRKLYQPSGPGRDK